MYEAFKWATIQYGASLEKEENVKEQRSYSSDPALKESWFYEYKMYDEEVIVDYFYHTLDQAYQNDWGLEMRCIT